MRRRAEGIGEQARTGVFAFKRWLEATTYLDLPFNSYEHDFQCTEPLLNGEQTFDLSGYFLAPNMRPVLVECKDVDTESNQGPKYRRFLAEIYSYTLKAQQLKTGDNGCEFIWVTKHPFLVTSWYTLTNYESIEQAVREHPDVLADPRTGDIDVDSYLDGDLLRLVASRLWLVIMNDKQAGISLTQTELLKVWGVLNRKAY